MPEQTSCTPEGGLEALAEALFTHHRLEIPCEGEGEHVPLNKDKAGRKDINGRLYRYWTCTRCHPRTKRNCRSYINEASKVLGREVVEDLASTVLSERRATGLPCDLLDAWIRGKLTPGAVSAPSQAQRKRKPYPSQHETPSKRPRICLEPDVLVENKSTYVNTDVLQAVYAARGAIDRWIAALTGTKSSSKSLVTPIKPPVRSCFDSIFLDDDDDDDELDLDEVILLPTPPDRAPLRSLTANVPDPRPSSGTVHSLVRRFRQATDASGRSTVRKEAKRLNLMAEFEKERSRGEKPSSTSRPSTTSGRLFERPRPAEPQVDYSSQVG
jgi:hypothetical protein